MIASILLCFSLPTVSDEEAVEAMAEYLMFQEYESGIFCPTRSINLFSRLSHSSIPDLEQFEKQTIPGAIHIEWRQVLERMNEIPTENKVIVFYNTDSRSAQAAFALRDAGFDNVVVMQTFYRVGSIMPLTNRKYRVNSLGKIHRYGREISIIE